MSGKKQLRSLHSYAFSPSELLYTANLPERGVLSVCLKAGQHQAFRAAQASHFVSAGYLHSM